MRALLRRLGDSRPWQAVARLPADGLVLAGFLALVVAAVWLDQPGRFTPDTVPGLYTRPGRLLSEDLSAWVPDPFLGAPNLQTGRAPVSAALAALAATGLPDWALVRLWRSLLLVVAALGAHALYRRWAGPGAGRAAAVAMAVVYTANPYVVVGGSTTPTLLPYALLPWAVLALLSATTRPGWRAPAAFALVLFAMSGIQVGVVPLLQLLVVPVVVLDARLRRGVPWPTVLAGVARCGVLSLLVSAYWLLPGLQALALGSSVAGATETAEVIAGPSSAAEVLRGLGMWLMYGRDAGGPFQPGFVAYLTSAPVVLASFALPVLAALGAAASRSRLRLAGVVAVALAVPVMVGLHPYDDPTPFGRLLAAAFEAVPGLIALRTTNKAGGVLLIGLALLVALGVERVVAGVRRRAARAVLAVLAGVSVLGATAPALAGPLHPVRLDLPGYWQEAARALDAEPHRGRVLVLPGTHVPTYRWGYSSPADHLEAVFTRGTVQRQAVPNGSPQAANLLAALDSALQEGTLTAGTLSTVARYLGVRDVVLRHDLVWEAAAGARPADVSARVAEDPGLQLVQGFGTPGENVVPPADAPEGSPGQREVEAGLPPVQHYRVVAPAAQVRAERLGGTVLVDGDNAALSDLLAVGLLAGRPGYRLLAGMTAAEVEQALADGARVVLTDSARRRDTAAGRLTAATSPTLPRDALVERPIDAFSDPAEQTVAVLPGAEVTATGSGSVFGPVPYGGPALALDGDPGTGWQPGDFGTAEGQRLELRLDERVPVSRVTLQALETSPARLAAVRLQVGGIARDVELPAGEQVRVDLPERAVDEVTVTVTRVEGPRDAGVGLAELTLDGVDLTRALRLPRTLPRLAEQLSERGRTLLDAAPQDVVLARARAREGLSSDDEESQLARDLTTTGTRSYDVGGVLRPGAEAAEAALDVLAGADPLVAATSSSRFFDDLSLRASRAVDGERGTAWVPGGDAVGESLVLAFPSRSVEQVVLHQDLEPNEVVDLLTRVRVELEDGRSVEAEVGPGTTAVPLPAGGQVGLLRLTLLDRQRVGALVRVSELEVAGVQVRADPAREATACVPVAALSGAPLQVRVDDVAALEQRRPTPFRSCGPPVRVGPGEQQLRTAPQWVLDRVHLRDLRPAPGAGAAPPVVTARSGSPTSWSAEVGRTAGPYALVLGQGWDPRWRASIDGADLGTPVALDGWSTGWRVDAPGPHVVEIRYGPERTAVAARVLSALALLGCLALVLRRRDPAPEPRPVPLRRPPPAGPARSGRRVAAWALVPVLMWLVGGPVVGGAGVLVAVAGARSARARRALPWLGALLLALVPVARLAGGLPGPAEVSAELVSGGLSELLALVGVCVLVAGVVAQELLRPGRDRR